MKLLAQAFPNGTYKGGYSLSLPGVIVHELSHLLVANMLFVHTGEVEFFPQIQRDHVKLGSVAIAKTDPLRRFAIGVAPLVVGLGIIFSLFWLFPSVVTAFSFWTVLFYYGIFEIGNTMFSSRKDLEGAIGLLILLLFLAGGFYLLGLRISAVQITSLLENQALITFFANMAQFLMKIVFLDAIVVTVLAILQEALKRR